MTVPIVLASSSATRAAMLMRAGVAVEIEPARVDEEAMRLAAAAEGLSPRDMADLLAEQKAKRVGARRAEALVIGADQVLEFEGQALGKAATPEALREQLGMLAGARHELHSAAVIYEGGRPVWRHVATAQMTMRRLSGSFLDDYVARNWDTVRHSVGGYMIESEGSRLMQRIDGDFFAILGLPLLPLLGYLTDRKVIAG